MRPPKAVMLAFHSPSGTGVVDLPACPWCETLKETLDDESECCSDWGHRLRIYELRGSILDALKLDIRKSRATLRLAITKDDQA